MRTPFISMLSFTASLNPLLSAAGGQYWMKARFPGSRWLKPGMAEHPTQRTTAANMAVAVQTECSLNVSCSSELSLLPVVQQATCRKY